MLDINLTFSTFIRHIANAEENALVEKGIVRDAKPQQLWSEIKSDDDGEVDHKGGQGGKGGHRSDECATRSVSILIGSSTYAIPCLGAGSIVDVNGFIPIAFPSLFPSPSPESSSIANSASSTVSETTITPTTTSTASICPNTQTACRNNGICTDCTQGGASQNSICSNGVCTCPNVDVACTNGNLGQNTCSACTETNQVCNAGSCCLPDGNLVVHDLMDFKESFIAKGLRASASNASQ
ncbi:hypothetical protein K450DRAFT_274225 [Umbelopsis ramanniana AG]|uniref:Uncharacterized protein n=1 Tax=Umbelopsis ramanniana AG TaxID=1314678 RepID=A0AAD5E4A5_UMBRA|nr:uncharacterized protein K450DRAFT_274225 [Umbelopsis ramanniana AG]KAI8576908.1 hypothetical protein K450DRAFT_274225 [Umbelopsis ramanniana AG]